MHSESRHHIPVTENVNGSYSTLGESAPIVLDSLERLKALRGQESAIINDLVVERSVVAAKLARIDAILAEAQPKAAKLVAAQPRPGNGRRKGHSSLVLQTLTGCEGLLPMELEAKTGLHKRAVISALTYLLQNGRVVKSGSGAAAVWSVKV